MLEEYFRITPEQELGHPALQAQHICGAAASDMSTPCGCLYNRPPAPRSPFEKLSLVAQPLIRRTICKVLQQCSSCLILAHHV